jgi:putative phosphoribosyl transferase
LRAEGPEAIVVAARRTPSAIEGMRPLVDEVVALVVPAHFGAVGEWYDDFRPTTDDEVVSLLRSRHSH